MSEETKKGQHLDRLNDLEPRRDPGVEREAALLICLSHEQPTRLA